MTEAEWLACNDPERLLAALDRVSWEAEFATWTKACLTLHEVGHESWSVHGVDKTIQVRLIRCIFGHPFRPVAFDPNWRTSDVIAMARGMYETRDFSAMPILADALQDAGCEDAAVLEHCRGNGPHVRGCWVVDMILEKS
jgi:hypothetical protein